MTYAVFSTGGKQFHASVGDRLQVEKLPSLVGEAIEIDQVLLVDVDEGQRIEIGAPFIPGAKVSATVIEQGRGEKIRVVKFRRRKHSMRRTGHRQYLTQIEITGIHLPSRT